MTRALKPKTSFRVGIDSYSLAPLRLSPFELLDWVKASGGDGVQFSEIYLPPKQKLDRPFLQDLAQYAAEKNLYLEWGGGQHIPFDLKTGRPVNLFPVNRRAAEQAQVLGVKAIRSCSGGLMRWTDDSPATAVLLKAMAKSLRAQKSMLKDLGVVLAIETHFEFTTFELARLFAECRAQPGDYLGICLDTMNLLTMLEDPVMATKRILPWVVMTHVKDGGILLTDSGLVSFPVEAGKGVVALAEIFRLLSSLGRRLRLSLEDHGGDFSIPIFDRGFLLKFPDLTVVEFSRLLALAKATRKLIDEENIAVVERSRWPEVCESRVRRGLHKIKEISCLAEYT
ncbi:MAG: sugar phosphate isomerase/epimerase [Acidobacteriota bacterium]